MDPGNQKEPRFSRPADNRGEGNLDPNARMISEELQVECRSASKRK